MNMGLSARIFNDMRTDIINGKYPVKSKLPPERELSLKYGASRFAVREAIAMLIQSGFVETHPQSGTYVVDYIREGSLDTLVQVLRIKRTIDRKTLESLLKFRHATEVMAAGEAALNSGEEDIAHLTEVLDRKKGNLGSIAVLTETDFDFHYSIISISGNIISQMVFKSFRPIYSFFTEYFYSLEGAPETSLQLNLKLVKALGRKDRNASEKAMAAILKHGEKKVNEAIKNFGQTIYL